MKRAAQRVAFWLIPSEDDRRRWQSVLDALATRFAAPRFDVHITLHVTPFEADEDIHGILSAAAGMTEPFEADAGPTGHTPEFFKTLFLRFSHPTMYDLGSRLRRACRLASDYQLSPHLSLLYHRLPEHDRADLAARADYAGRRVRFDRIAAVFPAPGELDFRRIDGWTVAHVAQLGRPLATG